MDAQTVPAQEPPQTVIQTLDLAALPRATALAPETPPDTVVFESDTQSRHDDLYLLAGDAVITYRDHTLRADTVTYNQATGEATANGHVRLTGGTNDESIQASHGMYNVRSQTGEFFDVTGSVSLRAVAEPVPMTAPIGAGGVGAMAPKRLPGYQTSNPFLFEGRRVDKTGPESYVVHDGSVTSCLLPHPDWQLYSSKFTLTNGTASAGRSTFKLIGVPLLFLPYVSHPVDSEERQSGLLIPVFSYSSASSNTGSKGLILGDQYYLAINRSTDLTLGLLYYSLRGFSQNGTFRFRGSGEDFFTAHFSALQDRGFYQPTQTGTTKAGVPIIKDLFVNQGGQDITTGFRRQLSPNTRFVGDGEYLSSYIYRQAFTENFNQAVSSDILSTVYITHQNNGYSVDGRFDRYEGLKVVPTVTVPGEEVKIFHSPSLDITGIDRSIRRTPLLWSFNASAAGLKRVQPNFVSSGIIERLDLRPEISLPLSFGDWHTLSSIAVRESFYSRSRKAPYGNGATPVELTEPVNRADLEINVDIRPPVVERTFTVPERLQWLLGQQVRHTLEPDITYRNVHGVDNFLSILRFDDADLVSDTDELKYALTQHLYFRPRPRKGPAAAGCPTAPAGAQDQTSVEQVADEAEAEEESVAQPSIDANGIPNASAKAPDLPTRTHVRRAAGPCAPAAVQQQEWFSWELAQKTFFAQNFGGAVIDNRRNIFESTLAFSGIAFLTEARAISPITSRMRFRTSSHTDIEWDFDYDTGATKFNSSNTFLDVHEGKFFGGFAYARLNAPGRFHSESISTVTNTVTGVTGTAISNFSQLRLLFGYGVPTRAGLSAAVSTGIDLNLGSAQYVTVQSSYNWNCCGLSLEYRKYDLGTVRNDGTYSFNFTLANIGTAGNLRRAESLF
jgi:LPS-assembly protein